MFQRMYFEKKTNCTCSNCGAIFDYSKAAIKEHNLYGITTQERRCPECNAPGFTMSKHSLFLRKYEQLNFE